MCRIALAKLSPGRTDVQDLLQGGLRFIVGHSPGPAVSGGGDKAANCFSLPLSGLLFRVPCSGAGSVGDAFLGPLECSNPVLSCACHSESAPGRVVRDTSGWDQARPPCSIDLLHLAFFFVFGNCSRVGGTCAVRDWIVLCIDSQLRMTKRSSGI